MTAKPLDTLTRFEALAQRWLEGSFTRLFRTRLHRAELAEQLIRALEDGQTIGPNGLWLAPDDYQVLVHPDDFARLGGDQDWAEIERKLANHLIDIAQQSGLILMRRPRVRLRSSDRVPPCQVRVQAHLTAPPALAGVPSETREIDTRQPQNMTGPPLLACHLQVGGRRLPLAASPVNLGRGLDNDVVVDHPRVSRHHAQLQQREGQWWLIDLVSANGTTVNAQPVSEAILHPGDVISLAGVEVRFELQGTTDK